VNNCSGIGQHSIWSSGHRGIGDLDNGIGIGCQPGIGNGIGWKIRRNPPKSGAEINFQKNKKANVFSRITRTIVLV